jgi:hypothetical protein
MASSDALQYPHPVLWRCSIGKQRLGADCHAVQHMASASADSAMFVMPLLVRMCTCSRQTWLVT